MSISRCYLFGNEELLKIIYLVTSSCKNNKALADDYLIGSLINDSQMVKQSLFIISFHCIRSHKLLYLFIQLS